MRHDVAAPFRIEFDLEPSVAELAPARARLGDWLREVGIERPVGEELLIVAAELWSNAAEATPTQVAPVHFVARHDGTAVHFEVSNQARPDEEWAGERPTLDNPLRDRGRGLAIVDAMTDTLVVNSLDGRTVVRCMRVLDRAPSD